MAKKAIKILLVDDEEEFRILIVAALAALGYEVYQAQDGLEGLAMAEKVRPDIILSDVVMPKKSGSDFLKDLRKTAWGKNIPFIVLTARVHMKDYFEMAHVDGFIEKPFTIEELVEKINHVLFGSDEQAQKKSDRTISSDGHGKREATTLSEALVKDVEGEMKDKHLDVSSSESSQRAFIKGPDPKQATSSAQEQKKILILEDKAAVLSVIKYEFVKCNYRIRDVRSFEECLRVAKTFIPDVVIVRQGLCAMDI